MKAISVEALSKTFSGGTVAVDEIGFSLDKGEIGVTVFLCTHQLRYAQEICTIYGLMDKGHLFATGNITELRAMVSRNRRVRVKASCLPKGMVYKELGDHIYDVDVASEHDIPLIVKRLVAIAVTVRSSAKARTIEEAQQRAVFLIFPILALVIGQFTAIRGFFWDWVPSW